MLRKLAVLPIARALAWPAAAEVEPFPDWFKVLNFQTRDATSHVVTGRGSRNDDFSNQGLP